jgi:sulfur carrier protein
MLNLVPILIRVNSDTLLSLSIGDIPRKISTINYQGKTPNVIIVCINGTQQTFEHQISVAELVASLNLTGKRIAIECNNEIVPRSLFAQRLVDDGDNIEVVVAVGGG